MARCPECSRTAERVLWGTGGLRGPGRNSHPGWLTAPKNRCLPPRHCVSQTRSRRPAASPQQAGRRKSSGRSALRSRPWSRTRRPATLAGLIGTYAIGHPLLNVPATAAAVRAIACAGSRTGLKRHNSGTNACRARIVRCAAWVGCGATPYGPAGAGRVLSNAHNSRVTRFCQIPLRQNCARPASVAHKRPTGHCANAEQFPRCSSAVSDLADGS